MEKVKRINFYGGAGCGKSTIAARTFAELKVRGYNVELVSEYVKPRAYQGRFPRSHEQLYVFAHQQHREDELLDHVEAVVSDSPLLMNAAYSAKYGFVGSDEIISLSKKFENDFPGIHLWVHRKYAYRQEGRYQTLEQSLEIDEHIRALMCEHLPPNRTYFDDMSFEDMIALVENHLR